MSVVMNTSGAANGVIEQWLDGVRGGSLAYVRSTGTDEVGINRIVV